MHFFFRTLSVIFIVLSCNSRDLSNKKDIIYSEIQIKYEYSDDLIMFFKNEFKKDLSQLGNGFIFFIPVNSCLPCVDETLSGLLETKSADKILNIVISGTTDDSLIKSQIDQVCKKYSNKVLSDIDSKIFRYETNIGGPSIIILDSNDIYQIILNEEVWKKRTKYLPLLDF